mgnify:CR=1 FL=1
MKMLGRPTRQRSKKNAHISVIEAEEDARAPTTTKTSGNIIVTPPESSHHIQESEDSEDGATPSASFTFDPDGDG